MHTVNAKHSNNPLETWRHGRVDAVDLRPFDQDPALKFIPL